MVSMIFAPLHIVSGYSFLQSGLTEERIIKGIKDNDYFAAGIADKEVMYGVTSFIKGMDSLSKPYLVGEEFEIEGDFLCLYVLNEEGYKNLIKLDLENQKEQITFTLLKEYSNGLAAILETNKGKFKELFGEEITTEFKKYLLQFANIFKDDFYLGIEVTSKDDVKYANRLRHFADEFVYNCIAFPTIRYQKKEDALIIDMVTAINDDTKIDIKKKDGQEYFMSETDYQKIYSKKELANTINLVKKSTFNYHQKRGELLHYAKDNAEQVLRETCEKALKEEGLVDPKYQERLDYELGVISQMGYCDYFLIVQDFVSYCKHNDILVGPGRGSAAGSLVSHLLGIVEINPLDYDLQFERFLNPFRKTMPDIDVDIMDSKRDQVIQYMRDKYGTERVANIITFQTIGAKQSLRDVGRIYDYPSQHIDFLSKRITEKVNSLREAYKKLPDFRSVVDSDKYYLEIVSLASKIEGLPRQSGLHASGVVLDERPLEESIPVKKTFDDSYISQYEMEYLEEQGLLKIDFLSLSNLTIIYNCLKQINAKRETPLTFEEIPYKDKKIFELISQNKTLGLFQIDTSAMRRSIQILKPDCFDDVVALLALGRPGPMQYISTFARRKEGKEKFFYISDDLKDILSSTYGIIVYQEQINSIATKMAGLSLAEADTFRRAISKKEREKILKAQSQFISGAVKKGYKEETAKKVFSDILKFAEYGFNKSHSVVYSIIACRMAWLKIHYPLEFYSALLDNASATSDSKFADYVFEMNSLNIKMLPPSINYSSNNFVIKDGALLFPLTGIKEITLAVMENLDKERKERGLFTNIFNFTLRMFKYRINANQLRYLIDAGAFDELYPSRASLRLSILSALQYAELNYQEDGQISIGIEAFPEPMINKHDDDPLENLYKEYEAIGAMLSSNPLSYKQDLLKEKGAVPIAEAKEMNNALVAGIVRTKKIIHTKTGTPMAFVKIFDNTGDLEITVFSNEYSEKSSLLEKNQIITAKVSRRISKDEISFIGEDIKKLEEEEHE